MIQSTRISMGLFFKYFLSLTKIDPGQNYISLPSIKSSTHIALLFMVSMGTQKLKAQSFFIFSLLLTLILFCITTLCKTHPTDELPDGCCGFVFP